MMLEGQLKGASELRAALVQVEEKGAKAIMRTALRAGAKIVADKMREYAPVLSGATREAIKVRAGKRSRNKVQMMAQVGAGAFKGKTFYAGFVNFGFHLGKRNAISRAISRAQRKRGANVLVVKSLTGRETIMGDSRQEVKGTHWMERAWNDSKDQMQTVVFEVAKQEIEAAIKESPALKKV